MLSYRSEDLYVEDVAVADIIRRFGTPLYVYGRTHMQQQYRTLATALAEVNPLICYSVKANSTQAVLGTFAELGAGFDIVSGGELFRAIRAGADPGKIVYAGVGKTQAEIEFALRQKILFFTVESEPEAARIAACACQLGTTARIAFRVNPDVDAHTHKYISTGKKENKFGLDIPRTLAACTEAARRPGLEVAGLHLHIGSQILTAQPFREALQKVADLCHELKSHHPGFRYLDVGGGIGIDYEPGQVALHPTVYAAAVLPALRQFGLAVVLEPGRFLVGNGGILICRVEYVKQGHDKKFVIANAGMNDLIRPALYQAHHEVLPVRQTTRRSQGDLVGPICESGDFLAANRDLPEVAEGEYLAVRSAGAYGFAMSSTYNSRPRAAEVMVAGNRAELVRQREQWDDLVRGETAFPA